MKTFAYCSRSFGRRMARLARTSPILCPPTTAETFDLSLLAGRDLVWFKLHGREGEHYWYGDHWTTALSDDQLAQADLSGAVVFVSNCWLTQEDGYPGPMLIALAQANPCAIVGGPGPNYAATHRVAGTDLLGLYLRFFMGIGFAPYKALRLAKTRLRIYRPDKITEDTLAFQLWTAKQLAPDPRSGATPKELTHA
jgi:hypothetical protein